MLIVLNIVVLLSMMCLHWYLSAVHGWFQRPLVNISSTLMFILTLAGFAIPLTPLVIDGLVLGSFAYFGIEWFRQAVRKQNPWLLRKFASVGLLWLVQKEAEKEAS